MVIKKILNLIVNISIPEIVGTTGGFITSSSVDTWYSYLKKPSFNPPDYIFGPVWTILYALMGISAFLIFQKEHKNKTLALAFYFGQLILNFLWTIIFFGAKNPFWAFIEIIILWTAILFTIINFWIISKKAALLLIPYLLWVSFASVLNYRIWVDNR